MIFCGIAAHDEKTITVLEIDPVIGHCATTERLSQSRNCRAVSYTSLMIDVDHPQASHEAVDSPTLVVVDV